MTNNKHPSFDIVESHGTELAGKRIVLCISGSVAVYKAIELARLLMRHGADVRCVASKAATRLVQPDYFKWATGNKVITKLTGELEHIKLADYGSSDLIIVFPSTANTLGKLANGIDDTPISTVLTVGFGAKIPILMCLAMHASMYENAAVKKNIAFLKNKIEFFSPNMIEKKAKVAEPTDVLEHVLQRFGHISILKNKKILITAGPTIEYIDPIRVITNQSTGKTGVLLALELASCGAKVTMIYGPGKEIAPKDIRVIDVNTAKQMEIALKKEMKKRFDVIIMAAAISDYTIKASKTKIKSDKDTITLKLQKIPKIINQIKKIDKNVLLVGFKAEANISDKELIKRAKKKLKESNSDVIIANDIGSMRYRKDPNKNKIIIVDSEKVKKIKLKSKEKIVKLVRKEIEYKFEK